MRTILKTLKFGAATGAVILLFGCDTPTPQQPPATAFKIPNMKRPNLVVSDLERALSIYRDVLGLQASAIDEGSKDSFSYPVFNVPSEANMRFASLHEPGEERILALTEITGMTLPTLPSAPHMSAVVFGIADLEAKFAKLEAMGLTVTASKIADGADFRFLEQAFIDPDGHLIVCYEILPPTPQ